MQDAGVRERVERMLERHKGDVRMLDAYWQWGTNPTPPSAGYALEENGGFIATNLLIRYQEPAIDLVQTLASECRELRQDASIYELQQAVISVLNGPLGDPLRFSILERLHQSTPARRLLTAWLVNRARWCHQPAKDVWLAGEYDWSLGMDLEAAKQDQATVLAKAIAGEGAPQADLPREAMAVGIVNRLFYRSGSGVMEPKLRPGPRVPMDLVLY